MSLHSKAKNLAGRKPCFGVLCFLHEALPGLNSLANRLLLSHLPGPSRRSVEKQKPSHNPYQIAYFHNHAKISDAHMTCLRPCCLPQEVASAFDIILADERQCEQRQLGWVTLNSEVTDPARDISLQYQVNRSIATKQLHSVTGHSDCQKATWTRGLA